MWLVVFGFCNIFKSKFGRPSPTPSTTPAPSSSSAPLCIPPFCNPAKLAAFSTPDVFAAKVAAGGLVAHPNGAVVPVEPADVIKARADHLAAVASA